MKDLSLDQDNSWPLYKIDNFTDQNQFPKYFPLLERCEKIGRMEDMFSYRKYLHETISIRNERELSFRTSVKDDYVIFRLKPVYQIPTISNVDHFYIKRKGFTEIEIELNTENFISNKGYIYLYYKLNNIPCVEGGSAQFYINDTEDDYFGSTLSNNISCNILESGSAASDEFNIITNELDSYPKFTISCTASLEGTYDIEIASKSFSGTINRCDPFYGIIE